MGIIIENDMSYNLNLEKISVQDYKSILQKQNLLPGRKCLTIDINKNFAKFDAMGIYNVLNLKKRLSSSLKIEAFSQESGISKEYLTILKREMGSLEQKPVPLHAFPDIDNALVSELYEVGIKTSKRYKVD